MGCELREEGATLYPVRRAARGCSLALKEWPSTNLLVFGGQNYVRHSNSSEETRE